MKPRVAAFIIAPGNFRDEELKVPLELLRDKGVAVVVASTDTATCLGMLGLRWKPDVAVAGLNLARLDALVLVGGTGATVYWSDTTVQRLCRDARAQGKVVGAICIAPVTLARAGLLRGHRATASESVSKELTRAGANYTGADVEIDGTLITASGPQAARKFGEALLEALR